eukprot:355342-Chlamydomonas_euryale.AAC.3
MPQPPPPTQARSSSSTHALRPILSHCCCCCSTAFFLTQKLRRVLPPNHNHCKEHHTPGLDLDGQQSPAAGSHTRNGCRTLATPATAAQDRVESSLLGLLNFHRSKVFNSVPPDLPVKGTFRRRFMISGQGINLVWLCNLRKSRKVVQPSEPSSWHPLIAELYIPKKSLMSLSSLELFHAAIILN